MSDKEVKLKGVWKGRDKSKERGFYIRTVDGRRTFYFTEEERNDAYDNLTRGFRPALSITPDSTELLMVAAMRKLMEERGATVMACMDILKRHLPDKRKTFHRMVEEFIADNKTRLEMRKIGKRSFWNYQHFATVAKESTRDFDLSSFDAEGLSRKLMSRYGSDNSFNTAVRHVNVMLRWAKRNSYLSEKCPLLEPIRGVVQKKTIFNRAIVEWIFETAELELVPLLALHYYAGVRPETSYHLKWGDFDFDEKVIWIDSIANKVAGMDCLEYVPSKVFDLLSEHRGSAKDEDRIRPRGFDRLMSEYRSKVAAKIGTPFPQDVARRTYCSHLVAAYASLEKAKFAMGHTNDSTMKKHYHRRVSQSEGLAYFSETDKSLNQR